jgi:hypothetical protein
LDIVRVAHNNFFGKSKWLAAVTEVGELLPEQAAVRMLGSLGKRGRREFQERLGRENETIGKAQGCFSGGK